MTTERRSPFPIDDPDGVLIRRATRVAIVLPALFWVCSGPLDQPVVALFSAFGCFAMLALADFGGPLPRRAVAYVVLTVLGAVLVAIGTWASGSILLAAVLMLVVGFAVSFAGALGGYYVAAGPALTLAYVLAATVTAPASQLPERLAGWVLAGAVSTLAAVALWPVHERRRIGEAITDACRHLAIALRSDAAADRAAADDAVQAARLRFWSSPRRPAGPSEHDRAVVRLLDALGWLAEILGLSTTLRGTDDELVDATADQLDRCGEAVARTEPVDADALDALDRARSTQLVELYEQTDAALAGGASTAAVVTRVQQAFLPRIAAHAAVVAATATTAMRTHPSGRAIGPTAARAGHLLVAHLRLDSVWFRNSLRMGVALAVAVAIALGGNLPHAFWVALGTLTALRSTALGTGRSVLAALVGTVAGFGVAVILIETSSAPPVLWTVLPVSVFLSAWAPSAVSFIVGQASFTVFVVVLFNLIDPVGWAVGVERITDIAVGCAVGLVVSLVFWPRGASAQLRRAIVGSVQADGRWFTAEVRRLTSTGGIADRADEVAGDASAAADARAAQWRADQALIVYLDERGRRRLPVPEAQTLVNTGFFLQLAALSTTSISTRPSVGAPDERATAPPCAAASAQVRRHADDAVAALVTATGGGVPDAADGSLTDDVVRCVDAQRQAPAGNASDALIRLVFAAAWVDRLGRLAAKLSSR